MQIPENVWIAFGDIHDDLGNFAKIPELNVAEGIIISGDLTNIGGVKQAERVMEQIKASSIPVLAQIGNMDRPEVNVWLTETGDNLHANVREIAPDVAIFGIGGSTFTPFSTPSEFPESDYGHWLDQMWPTARKYKHTVLVSHNPPKDTACDAIGNGAHVGSAAVREFIEEHQPEICICGHIHEGRAVDHIGRTLVINPGQLNQGGYVVLRLKDDKLSAELCQAPA